MRLLLIGAPGSGKGTQAERLAARFGIAHISSGDLLRQHVRDQTSLGQRVKSYVDAGDLVPDGVVMDMLRKPVRGRGRRLCPRRVPADRRASEGVLRGGPRVRGRGAGRDPPGRPPRRACASAGSPRPGRRRHRSCYRPPAAGVPGNGRCPSWSTTRAGNGCSRSTAPSRRTPCTRTSSGGFGGWPPSLRRPDEAVAGPALPGWCRAVRARAEVPGTGVPLTDHPPRLTAATDRRSES